MKANSECIVNDRVKGINVYYGYNNDIGIIFESESRWDNLVEYWW